MENRERRVTSKETIKRRTIRDMQTLGTHKPEYNRVIDLYAGLVRQYLIAEVALEESNFEFTEQTAAGNPKKSGIISVMESLRKDILAYSDRLALNPKSLESITLEKKQESVLASVLSQLD